MSHLSRSKSFVAINAFGLALLGGLLSSCALLDEEPAPPPAPAPVVRAMPTPAPTPAPVVYGDGSGYLDGAPAAEIVPPSLQPATEELRAAAVTELLKDPSVTRRLKEVGAGYLAVGSNKDTLKDPSDALLAKIKVAGMTLKKYSQCVAGASGVRDAASGARGAVIRVCRICWTGPASAMVEYGYSTGGIKGQTVLSEAQKVGGTWTFTERKISIY